MSEQRILRDTSVTLKRTFYTDGTATDADGTVNVAITDEAGDTVVATTAATGEGSGVYSYLLTPQTQLNRLTVTWTGDWSAVAQTFTDYVEVVGSHLFSEAEARAFHSSLLTSATVYPDKAIAEARDRISDEFAQICGVSFVPKYEREQRPGAGARDLIIRWPKVTTVINATIGGTAVTSNVTADPLLPKLYKTSGSWTAATAADPLNVVVEYEHGWQTPPPDIKRAALILLHNQIIRDQAGSPLTDRVITITHELGTERVAQPGFRNAPYGIPIVDQTLVRYSLLQPVF